MVGQYVYLHTPRLTLSILQINVSLNLTVPAACNSFYFNFKTHNHDTKITTYSAKKRIKVLTKNSYHSKILDDKCKTWYIGCQDNT